MLRAISPSELAVLERTLQVGGAGPVPESIFSSLQALQVTAVCKCGCATVWFGPKGDAASGHRLAEAQGTVNGQSMEVFVWSEGESVIGLELVGPGPMPLPDARTIRGYGEA
jgi:hypothetical protein